MNNIQNNEMSGMTVLLVLVGIFMLMAVLLPVNTSVSERTLGHIINADTLDVVVEVQLGYYEEEITKETEVTYAALQDAGLEYINEVEEVKRIEKEKQEVEDALKKKEEEAEAVRIQTQEREQNRYNVYKITGHSAAEFDVMLSGTGLAGMGDAYVEMERMYGINGVYAIGVALHESANGYSNLAETKNNFYGMRVKGEWLSFTSKESSVASFGRLMNNPRYKGKSITSIGDVYCPTETGHWVNTVINHMDKVQNKL